MQIKRQFYEFLARGGRDGTLQGYHVIFADTLCDDKGNPIKNENGENKMETFTSALSLENAGIDLPKILNDVLGAALKRNDICESDLKAVKAELEAAKARITELENPVGPGANPEPVQPIVVEQPTSLFDKVKGWFK